MSKNEELEQVDYNSNESNAIATYSTPQLNLPQALTSSFENNDNVVRNNNNNQVQGQYNDYQNQSTGSYNTQQTTITNQSNYDNQGAYNGPRKQFKRNDAGKIFVGGLNWETSERTLTEYFADFGEITDSVVMKDHMTGKSRGFGFVTFADPSVIETIACREHFLDGKRIDPKSAAEPEKKSQNEKIFVGGIHADVSESELIEFFTVFGEVREAHLMYDRETGRARGFGFITFASADVANEVLAKQGALYMRSKQIEVKSAQPKQQRDSRKPYSAPQQQNLTNPYDNSQQYANNNYNQSQGNNMMYMNPMMMPMYQPQMYNAPQDPYQTYADPSKTKEAYNDAPKEVQQQDDAVGNQIQNQNQSNPMANVDPAMMDAYMKMYTGFYGNFGNMQQQQLQQQPMQQDQMYDMNMMQGFQQNQMMQQQNHNQMMNFGYASGQQNRGHRNDGDRRRDRHRSRSRDDTSREFKSRPRERDVGYKTREERGETKRDDKKSHPYARQ